MTRRFWINGALLLFCGLAFEPAALAAGYAGSPAEKTAAAAGKKLVREVALDIDGDGKPEVGVVEAQDNQMRVVILAPTGSEDIDGGYKRVAESSSRPARRLIRLEAVRLVGSSAPELLAIFEDPSPDETSLSVRIMGNTGKGVREIFGHTFFLPQKSEKEPNVVSLGDATPHYTVEDVDAKSAEQGGDKEIIWVKDARKLTLPGKDGPVTFVIGAVRTVFRFDPMKSQFVEGEKDQVVDFLEPKAPSDVEASSQSAKIWGTAQAFWAADDDLTTSWNVTSKTAVGQNLTLKFKSTPQIKMIRIVPGCGNSAEEWNRFDRLQVLRMVLGSGLRFEIDRKKLDQLPPGVKAVGEFPLDEGFGAQLLIFLDDAQDVPWGRLEVVKLEKSKAPKKQATGELCVSEISFH